MPGLSFLNKKSWHTTNVKNVEKVWLAEKKADEEQKRLAELQKQLMEERQILELRQLQAAQGQVTKTIDNSLDWMYEGPMSSSQKQQSSEEYLLGKIYNGAADHSKVDPMAGMGAPQQPAKWLNKVASKNDSFTRTHEDPFIMIKQEENKRREKVINNPIKMDRIKQKIADELERKEEKKRMKKQAKKEKKEMKKETKRQRKEGTSVKREHTSSSESDGSSSGSEAEAGDRRERSPGRPRAADAHVKAEHVKTQDLPNKAPRHRSPSRSRSADRKNRRDDSATDYARRRDDSRDRGNGRDADRRDSGRHDRESDRRDRDDGRGAGRAQERGRDRDGDAERTARGDGGDRSSRRSPDRYHDRRRDRSDSRHRDGRRGNDRSRRSPSPRRGEHGADATRKRGRDDSRERTRAEERGTGGDNDRERDRKQSDAEDSKKYGLIRNPNSSASAASGGSHLGPNPELLRRKEEAERKAEAERRNRTRADLSTMTEEERLRKIQAMQADADQNDALRASRLSSAAARTTTQEDEHTGKASFLQSMRKEVYTSGSVDMSKRIDQNKNSRQSSADIDSAEGFIRKG